MTKTSTDKPVAPKTLRLPDGRRIRQVRVYIHQPKLRDEPLERVISIEEILAMAEKYKAGARRVEQAIQHHKVISIVDWNRTYLNPNPNEEECAFCRAMAECPNATEQVRRDVVPLGAIEDLDDVPDKKQGEKPEAAAARRKVTERLVPEDMEHLNLAMSKCGFIEDWVLAVRARMEQRLLAGETAEDFGLDTGRKGARAFTDPEEATHLLRKKFRLKEKDVFNFKLKTPTQLEELTKPIKDPVTGEVVEQAPLGEKRWVQICKLVDQKPPKPSVKRKDLIKTPYVMPITKALDAIPDDDETSDSDLY